MSAAGTAVSGVALGSRSLATQTLGPSTLLDAPAPVLAALAFASTVVFGGAVIYVLGGRLDEAVDASMTNPVVSVLYGTVAFGLVVFVVGYAFSQLSRLGVATGVFATLTLSVLGLLVLTLSGFGFVVVGAWLTASVGSRDPWVGLVAVGLVAAAAWLVLPFALAALLWFVIAGVGVGGPTRRWIHADQSEANLG